MKDGYLPFPTLLRSGRVRGLSFLTLLSLLWPRKGGGKDCLTEPVEPVVATGEVRKPPKGGASEGKS